MKEVVLQIPTLDSEQNIEIDVKINAEKKPQVQGRDRRLETDETLVEDRMLFFAGHQGA